MTRSAADEHYGGSITVSIGADYRLRLPSGPGGCRLYDITATTSGLKVRLPVAGHMRKGGPIFTVINRATSSASFTIVAQDGSTTVDIVAAGSSVDLLLIANDTPNGTWRSVPRGTATKGTDLTV